MKLIPICITALIVAVAVAGCVVQSPPPSRPPPAAEPAIPSPAAIDARQRQLEARIEDGHRAGHLTNDEHRWLRGEADNIRREERRYMSDGHLSPEERRALGAHLDRLANEVQRQMRDRDRR